MFWISHVKICLGGCTTTFTRPWVFQRAAVLSCSRLTVSARISKFGVIVVQPGTAGGASYQPLDTESCVFDPFVILIVPSWPIENTTGSSCGQDRTSTR